MSKDSQKTDTQSLRLPKAPGYVTEPLEGIIGAAYNLGGRNPQDFVPGPTSNDLASFAMGNNIASRYGATPMPGQAAPNPNSINISRSQGGGQGLFESLGIRQPNQTNYDWDAVAGDRPDLQAAYSNLTPQQHSDIARVTGNPDGRVSLSDFTRYQVEDNAPNRTPEYEARLRELSGFSNGSKGSDPRSGQSGRDIILGPDQRVQAGPAASSGFNPLELYGQAAAGTRAAGTAGPNTFDGQSIFDMLLDNENAPSVTAGRVSAQSLLDNLQNYISPYTENVVDSTMADFDEEAARTRAAQAATAAGNGAARGTRNSIFEAALEGEIGRARATTAANLRDQAFTTGAGLSADDANRRQSASTSNAELSQRASEANAQMELNRLLQTSNLMFENGTFNANQADEALNRAMQGSAQLADIGSTYQQNERQDIGLLSQLGAQERDIQRQQSTADIALLDTIANLLGGMGVNTSQVTGVSDTSSTTQRAQPGLLSTLGSVVDLGSNFVGLGQDLKNLRK
jgi:hypothetical protein